VSGNRLIDFQGREISLTAERREHILEHPEMADLGPSIAETLLNPERVVQSASEAEIHPYYRFRKEPSYGRTAAACEDLV